MGKMHFLSTLISFVKNISLLTYLLSWVVKYNWVPKPSEASSMGFVVLAVNLANPAKTWLFIYFKEPSKAG